MLGRRSPFWQTPVMPPEYGEARPATGGFGGAAALQGANDPGALRAQYLSAQGDLSMADKLLNAGYVPDSGALGALAMIANAYAGRKLKMGAEERVSDAMSKMFAEDSAREREAIAAKKAQDDQAFSQKLAQIEYEQAAKAKYGNRPSAKTHKVGNQLVTIGEDGTPKVVFTGKPAGGGGGAAPLASQREFEMYKAMSPEERSLYDSMKGRNRKGVTVYDPNTGQPIMEMGGGSGELGKPVQNKLQTDILDAENTLANLDAAGGKFSSEYLTAWGRSKAKAGEYLDKLGLPDVAGLKDFNANRSALIQDVDQFFQEYRKYITGAAAAQREIEDLKKASLDSSLGPTEFQARYNNLMSKMRSEIDRKKQQLQGGIQQSQRQSPQKPASAPAANREDLLNRYL